MSPFSSRRSPIAHFDNLSLNYHPFDLLTDIAFQGDFDLSKGESRESTTTYGLSFLEHIRKTADKA